LLTGSTLALMNRTGRRSITRRAFQARCFLEEKHLLLATSHLAMAAANRKRYFCQAEDQKKELEEAERAYCKQVQELGDQLQSKASQEALADREVMMGAVSAFSELYFFCSGDLHNDPGILLAAMQQDPECIMYAGEEIRADRETMLTAVSLDGRNLHYVSEELQNDKDFVLTAIEADAWAMAFASETLKNDREVVLAALRQQQAADLAVRGNNLLQHVSPELRADEDVVLEAVRADGSAVALASWDLRADKEFILKAMRIAPVNTVSSCYQWADARLQTEISLEDFVGAAASVLALPGENAPVLTFKLGYWEGLQGQNNSSNSSSSAARHIEKCEVSLMSGASFTCGLAALSWGITTTRRDDDDLDRDSDSDSDEDYFCPGGHARETGCSTSSSTQGNELHEEMRMSPSEGPVNEAAKAQRPEPPSSESSQSMHSNNEADTQTQTEPQPQLQQTPSDTSQPTHNKQMTVGNLTRMVLHQLPRHVELEHTPHRIFGVFVKNDGAGEAVQVTPWDWNRQLVDYL